MEKRDIPKRKYVDFSAHIHEKVHRLNLPVDGSLELTLRCNLNCAHCYCDQDSHEKEISTKKFNSIIDEVAAEGCLWLLFTGGEPLLREDFMEIYSHANERGILNSLFTNATLITGEIADFLAKHRPFQVEVSLYGATEETYERVTGVPGSFRKCMEGIRLLQERNILIKLKTVLISLNRHEIWMMDELAKKLGVDFRFDACINPGINGSKEPLKVRLTPSEIIEFDTIEKRRREAWTKFCRVSKGLIKSDYLYVCGAGRSCFHIDPYGMLYPCLLSRSGGYDLKQGNFKEGWYHHIPENVLSRKITKKYKCRECEIIAFCGYCPAWSELECGDPETPVEFLCELSRLRAERFGGIQGERNEANLA